MGIGSPGNSELSKKVLQSEPVHTACHHTPKVQLLRVLGLKGRGFLSVCCFSTLVAPALLYPLVRAILYLPHTR